MFWSTAYAQATSGAVSPARPSMIEMIFPFIAIMFVFYFFQSRPQQKRQKLHQDFLTALKRGDEVVTTGGIIGEVVGLTEKFITLEIAENVRIRVLRSQILGSTKEGNS
jgi:preprotein translocase subunit YajC